MSAEWSSPGDCWRWAREKRKEEEEKWRGNEEEQGKWENRRKIIKSPFLEGEKPQTSCLVFQKSTFSCLIIETPIQLISILDCSATDLDDVGSGGGGFQGNHATDVEMVKAKLGAAYFGGKKTIIFSERKFNLGK